MILALLILVLPGPAFLALSNYLQVLTALAGAVFFLLCRDRAGSRIAAAGLGLWGIANTAWYLAVLSGMRSEVFPGIIDIAMIAAFVLIAYAIRAGAAQAPAYGYLPLAVIVLCLIGGIAVLAVAGAGLPALATLLYFLACGYLLAQGIACGGRENLLLTAGTLLVAIAFIAYPLREMFFPSAAAFSVIGTFVAAGFSLIVLSALPAGKA